MERTADMLEQRDRKLVDRERELDKTREELAKFLASHHRLKAAGPAVRHAR